MGVSDTTEKDWEEHFKKILAETEQIAMCESCIHKVSADDIRAIRNSAIDECIEVIERHTYDCSIIEKLERLKESEND